MSGDLLNTTPETSNMRPSIEVSQNEIGRILKRKRRTPSNESVSWKSKWHSHPAMKSVANVFMLAGTDRLRPAFNAELESFLNPKMTQANPQKKN
jgi:hypothetical protein